MKKSVRKLLAVNLAVLSFVMSSCGSGQDNGSSSTNSSDAGLEGPFLVAKVTDGDTIHVIKDGVDVKIRIIGIDTPETVSTSQPVECYGPEASNYATQMLSNSSVYLEFDSTQGEFDKYGRTLAHVWTKEKTLYAADAILHGFGEEKTYANPYHHRELFIENQKLSKKSKSGLWGAC